MNTTMYPGTGRSGVESNRSKPVFSPATDILETPEALVLICEMPGVEADGVSVTLEKRVLTIRGMSSVTYPAGYALAHGEYRDGNYERSFTLSDAIDGAAIDASMRDGVLRVTMPKIKPMPAKTITVKCA